VLASLIDELIDPEISHDEVAITERRALGLAGKGDELTHLVHVGGHVPDVEFDALGFEISEGFDAPRTAGFDVKDRERLRHG
jgi:hypothetical protein